MAEKREYQVTYRFNHILGVPVTAESPEQAMEIAKAQVDKAVKAFRWSRIGIKDGECVDYSYGPIGYADLDGWDLDI